jgi:hypothetical protein
VIPGKIVRFLEQHATNAFAGTRNEHLVPYVHLLSGWRVGAGARTMTVFVLDPFRTPLIESLDSNGELAITVEEFPSHETYQFKGHYLRHGPLQPDDLEAQDRIHLRRVKNLRPIYGDTLELAMTSFLNLPSVAVEVEMREIYQQTPGPGAGARLVPPAPEL